MPTGCQVIVREKETGEAALIFGSPGEIKAEPAFDLPLALSVGDNIDETLVYRGLDDTHEVRVVAFEARHVR